MKKKRDITILCFDDEVDFDEYKKFEHEKPLFIKSGFDYTAVSYKNVLEGKLPRIKTKKIIIFLFFPFDYWNKHIEYRYYRGIYGNHIFHKKFMHFWREINDAIGVHFSGKEIMVINDPFLSGECRDKDLVKLKLSRAGILNPRQYHATRSEDIYNLLAEGKSLFLKPRYGSMGKGITYISSLSWQTNFIFKGNRIISRRSDYGWKFRDITGNSVFLSSLIKKDIVIEEAIDSLILKRKRIDLRIYTFFKKAIYVYPKTNYPEKITTNISQGGKGDPHILELIPKYLVNRAKNAAIDVSRVLNLDLAGTDIILDRNRKDVYIVDVNVFPGLPKRKTFNFARRIVKELLWLDNKGKLEFRKHRIKS